MRTRNYFDVAQLIYDMGGINKVAEITGKHRTAPYRWIQQGFVSTRIIEQLKDADPSINIDSYLKR